MRGATPKDHKDLLKRIKAHLRVTQEPPYSWSNRVMGDKTFLWKLETKGRMPFKKTLKRIEADIKKQERAMVVALRKRLTAASRIKSGIRNGH